MLCGIAQSLSEMVLFRLAQGVFGAALVPLSQAIMLDLYPIEQRGQAMAIWGMGVMVGPILGPTLGGYLTDVYDWRWVFFINLPFGILAIFGLVALPQGIEARRRDAIRLDGFFVLSLGIGALQLMLDRGEQKDWFSSSEILIEATLAGLGLYLFVVHVWLAEKPFITPRIFRDVNFMSGFLMMFAICMVLLASSAVLAPYLETLAGYPVREAGLLMAPRGLGSMASMLIAGRLLNRFDGRLIMFAGIVAMAYSFWEMTTWTADIGPYTLATVTILQGSAWASCSSRCKSSPFRPCRSHLRTDGTALFSLVRNVGAAIGVSVSFFTLAQNTQIVHSQIAEAVTPFNRMLQTGGAYLLWNSATSAGLAALNAEVTRQATTIAYADDFMLMFWVSIPAALLLLMMRAPQRAVAGAPVHAALD